jgi:uncharacterized protein YxeA
MKKIIILIFTLLFLTSCSLFTTKSEQIINTDKESTEDKVDTIVSKDTEKDQKDLDENLDEKDINSNEVNDDDVSEKSSAPDEKKINSVSSTKSDDELVEEAIKDIESLFDDIEKSVK